MLRVVIHGNKEVTAGKGRWSSLFAQMSDDGSRPVRDDAKIDAPEIEMEHSTSLTRPQRARSGSQNARE